MHVTVRYHLYMHVSTGMAVSTAKEVVYTVRERVTRNVSMQSFPGAVPDENGYWVKWVIHVILYCRDRNIGKRRALLYRKDDLADMTGGMPEPRAAAATIKALLPALAADAAALLEARDVAK